MNSRKNIKKENVAYDELVNAGYRPQGFDMEINKVVVMKIENEHTNDEHRKIYYYDNWVNAAKSLIGKEVMTHNEYQNFLETNASRFHNEKDYTLEDYEKDAANVKILDYDLTKYSLSEKIEKVINTDFDTNGVDKFGNELFKGHCEIASVYQLIAKPLECKVGFDGCYSGFYYNPENKMVVEYAEGDVTLIICEDREKYIECLQNTVEFYNKDYDADIHCPELEEDNDEIENDLDN